MRRDMLCALLGMSQGVLVANRRSLTERPAQLLPVVHELLERLDAHLKAEDYYSGGAGGLLSPHTLAWQG